MAASATGTVDLKTRVQFFSAVLDSDGQYLIQGKVVSRRAACRFQRKVRLFTVHRESTSNGGERVTLTLADATMTNSGVGLFTFRAPVPQDDGLLVNILERHLTLKSGKRLHCGFGVSKIVFPDPSGGPPRPRAGTPPGRALARPAASPRR